MELVRGKRSQHVFVRLNEKSKCPGKIFCNICNTLLSYESIRKNPLKSQGRNRDHIALVKFGKKAPHYHLLSKLNHCRRFGIYSMMLLQMFIVNTYAQVKKKIYWEKLFALRKVRFLLNKSYYCLMRNISILFTSVPHTINLA